MKGAARAAARTPRQAKDGLWYWCWLAQRPMGQQILKHLQALIGTGAAFCSPAECFHASPEQRHSP